MVFPMEGSDSERASSAFALSSSLVFDEKIGRPSLRAESCASGQQQGPSLVAVVLVRGEL